MERNRVFISYSHQDLQWMERLRLHLAPVEQDGRLDLWIDTKIETGDRWRDEVEDALAAANVAVLLISPEFLASRFITRHEVPALLEAASSKGARLLCVYLKASMADMREYEYQEDGKERKRRLTDFQGVNSPDRPLRSFTGNKLDQELVRIARVILDAAGVTATTSLVAEDSRDSGLVAAPVVAHAPRMRNWLLIAVGGVLVLAATAALRSLMESSGSGVVSSPMAQRSPEGALPAWLRGATVEQIADEVVRAAGVPRRNFTLKAEPGFSAGAAVSVGDKGSRVLLYDPTLVEGLGPWERAGVLAHEIGHHLAGHVLEEMAPEGHRRAELEADQISGRILRRLGASLEEAQAMLRITPPDTRGDPHYPIRSARLDAIRRGWSEDP